MRYASLFAYHFIYFITTGMSTFVPKFYGEIGLSDSRIGLLTSVPTLIALLVAVVALVVRAVVWFFLNREGASSAGAFDSISAWTPLLDC